MSDISFAHFASTGKNLATRVVVEQIRKLYPHSYYFLASDAVDELSPIAKEYNLDYHFFTYRLGYPTQPYGYRIDKVLEFLSRFHRACTNTDTSHILMVEDDVWVRSKITVDPTWELAASYLGEEPRTGNLLTQPILEIIEFYSGKKPNVIQYGSGGGSIFNVRTFLDNYEKIVDFFTQHLTTLQDNFNPTLGWIDCFMTVYYLLCGKDYTRNPHLIDTHNHDKDFDYDGFVQEQPAQIQIVNNYKQYYWTN